MRPGFVGKTGLIIGGSSSIGKAVGTLQLEKRAEAVVIMGKKSKETPGCQIFAKRSVLVRLRPS
jgi:short-subunit dehydrogenase involved in D-alanine esterification of teichoic acids